MPRDDAGLLGSSGGGDRESKHTRHERQNFVDGDQQQPAPPRDLDMPAPSREGEISAGDPHAPAPPPEGETLGLGGPRRAVRPVAGRTAHGEDPPPRSDDEDHPPVTPPGRYPKPRRAQDATASRDEALPEADEPGPAGLALLSREVRAARNFLADSRDLVAEVLEDPDGLGEGLDRFATELSQTGLTSFSRLRELLALVPEPLTRFAAFERLRAVLLFNLEGGQVSASAIAPDGYRSMPPPGHTPPGPSTGSDDDEWPEPADG
ncbi:hypothetical protein AB0Q95_44815 [Streptomyces sp. NPDC059900]|uniref:hypothetical protein n=1 Tax=Streptomyces sp. NPDC059900 TaxID=3155816 RepID=UPI003419457B